MVLSFYMKTYIEIFGIISPWHVVGRRWQHGRTQQWRRISAHTHLADVGPHVLLSEFLRGDEIKLASRLALDCPAHL